MSEKIELQQVTDDTPGHFHIMRRQMEIQRLSKSPDINDQIKAFDLMIEFVLDRVTSPDRDTARDLITGPDGLSKNEITAIFQGVSADKDPLF